MSYAENLTPTQRQLAAERKARLQRMYAAAVPVQTKKVEPEPNPVKPASNDNVQDAELRERFAAAARQMEAARVLRSTMRLDELRRTTHFREPEPEEKPVPSISRIKHVVAQHFNVSVLDMESQRRTMDIVRPRQVAVYLAKNLTRRSLPAIGRCFGGRDHTTALASVRRIEKIRAEDSAMDRDIKEIKAKLEAELQVVMLAMAEPCSEGLSG
jgi:chromosomal replication initiation ATPase DnaA